MLRTGPEGGVRDPPLLFLPPVSQQQLSDLLCLLQQHLGVLGGIRLPAAGLRDNRLLLLLLLLLMLGKH